MRYFAKSLLREGVAPQEKRGRRFTSPSGLTLPKWRGFIVTPNANTSTVIGNHRSLPV